MREKNRRRPHCKSLDSATYPSCVLVLERDEWQRKSLDKPSVKSGSSQPAGGNQRLVSEVRGRQLEGRGVIPVTLNLLPEDLPEAGVEYPEQIPSLYNYQLAIS